MTSQLFYCAANQKEWLDHAGLATFEQFMQADVGTLVERDHKREVRRIEFEGQAIYLKRRHHASFRESLEMLCAGRRAHTHTYNEFLHIKNLHAAKLPVMTVIAAGEMRQWGFPARGFVATTEVKGSTLDSELTQAITSKNVDKEQTLLQDFGRLLASTHKAGFYAAVRLKDVFLSDGKMVMIDRETRNPYPSFRASWRARRSLQRSFRRIARDNHHFGITQQEAVMNAYQTLYNECD